MPEKNAWDTAGLGPAVMDHVVVDNVKIVGESGLGEGSFNRVSIVGDANVQEDLHAQRLSVMGTLKVGGNLISKEAKIMGTLNVGKACTIHGAHIMGEVYVGGEWKGNRTLVRGQLTIEGPCATEEMNVQGSLHIKGLCNFDCMEIKSLYPSKMGEMGGHKLNVKKPRFSWRRVLRKSLLEAECIEADEIDIDYTHAKIVRGNRIRIGKHCRIGRVEYSESFMAEVGAVIEEKEQTKR